MAPEFFPLDEALGLSAYSPYSQRVLAWLVRLGAEMPFARAAFWLEELTGVVVSAATVRRQTEAVGATAVAQAVGATAVAQAVGATAVAQADAQGAALGSDLPLPPERAERRVLGADGAMVPLVGGEWAEVKLVSIGDPVEQGTEIRTTQVSYCARLADAATFERVALGELQRRGVFHAAAVAAVQDGAIWLQGFVDYHRPDALRILDWAHAVEHLSALVAHLFGEGTARTARVVGRLRRWLWEQGPDRVLRVLAAWVRARPNAPDLARAVAYFTERRAQLDYPAFRTAGWPVGSGATESGHKQVMQARMKRAGMRWARTQVNPLLALTTLDHNGRWHQKGAPLLQAHQTACAQAHRTRQHVRRLLRHPPPVLAVPAPPPPPPAPAPRSRPTLPHSLAPSVPPAPHPWRRYGAPLSLTI